jgi:hypothetical protein
MTEGHRTLSLAILQAFLKLLFLLFLSLSWLSFWSEEVTCAFLSNVYLHLVVRTRTCLYRYNNGQG